MSVSDPTPVRVLLTGMSGTGKSTLVAALRRRGLRALDADDDEFSEPRSDGRWGWRVRRVEELLAAVEPGGVLVFAGCSEEQAALPFDRRVVLRAPRDVVRERLRTRTTNAYGREGAQLAQVLADLEEVEPLLLRSADLVLDATRPVDELADELVAWLERRGE